MTETEAMQAAAALAFGVQGRYWVNPSFKVSPGRLDAERLLLTWDRPVAIADIRNALDRLGSPQQPRDELMAASGDAWRFYLGRDGKTTTRAYFEMPGKHLGWKWSPYGDWYVTEYELWGPPYPTPVSFDEVSSELSSLVPFAPAAVAHALVILRIASTRTSTFPFYWSNENGERRGIYIGLPVPTPMYRNAIEALCHEFAISDEDMRVVLDWMTEPSTIAVGLDAAGEQYVTVYERSRWMGMDPEIPWRY